MSSLPKGLALLGGIVAFVATLLVGLLCEYPPLPALKKAALCAVVVGAVAWLCTHVALDVVLAGLRAHHEKTNT